MNFQIGRKSEQTPIEAGQSHPCTGFGSGMQKWAQHMAQDLTGPYSYKKKNDSCSIRHQT